MLCLLPPDTTFDVPVLVDVPGSDTPHECTVDFLLLPTDVARAKQNESDEAFFEAVVRGWKDIQQHDKRPLPYSEENRKVLANVSYFARAVGKAYTRWSYGLPEKNSATSLSPS